jgi:hypothetical protein
MGKGIARNYEVKICVDKYGWLLNQLLEKLTSSTTYTHCKFSMSKNVYEANGEARGVCCTKWIWRNN